MYVYVIICTSPPCHLLIDTPETLLIHASSKGPFNYPHPSLNICLFEHMDSQFIVPCSVTHTSRGKNKTVCRSPLVGHSRTRSSESPSKMDGRGILSIYISAARLFDPFALNVQGSPAGCFRSVLYFPICTIDKQFVLNKFISHRRSHEYISALYIVHQRMHKYNHASPFGFISISQIAQTSFSSSLLLGTCQAFFPSQFRMLRFI